MLDSTMQPDLATEIRKLKSQVEALQMASRASRTSVQNGTFVVLNDSGDTVVEVGRIGSDYGLRILTDSGVEVFKVTDVGAGVPTNNVPMHMIGNALQAPASWLPQGIAGGWTDQAAYITMFQGRFTAVGPNLACIPYTYMTAASQIGYTMTVYEESAGSGYRTAVASSSSTTTGPQPALSGAIPAGAMLSGTDPRGKTFVLELRTRRDSGADRVGVSFATAPYNY